jgi:hypothetical protein
MATPKGQIGTPGSRTDADVLEAIDDGLGRGGNPRQVYGALMHMERFAGRVPSLKTITRRAKQRRPPAVAERWSLSEADPEEVPVVLSVFAAMAKRDRVWQCQFVTREQAQVLVRIQAVVPDLDPWVAYQVADGYVSRRRRGLQTLGLELGLAFAPWRSEASATELRRVLDAGFVSSTLRADLHLVRLESGRATQDPIAETIDRRYERAYEASLDAAEDELAGLTDDEGEGDIEQNEDAREFGFVISESAVLDRAPDRPTE